MYAPTGAPVSICRTAERQLSIKPKQRNRSTHKLCINDVLRQKQQQSNVRIVQMLVVVLDGPNVQLTPDAVVEL